MTTASLLACVLAAAAGAQDAATAAAADPWAAVRFLEGEWTGSAEGQPGIGTVHRTYQFVLQSRFLHERNVSAYAPRQPNTAGELHEHWSLWSHDRRRRGLVLRQFHQEGFVNQYFQVLDASSAQRLVFESESIENIPAGFRARETYDLTGPDSFVETFELAAPGQDFELYSKTTFVRVGTP
jgi:hypothetical protein